MPANPANTTPTLLARLNRFGVDNGGATAVVAAMLFPVVVGGLGLGAETGYWYLSQRKLQHAVDVSVHAAGARKRAGDTIPEIEAAARHVAIRSGFRPASAALTVNPSYTSAAHPGAMLVEVTATETQPRLLSSVFNNEPVTFGARAVAKVIPDPNGSVACVLALSPTAPRAVSMGGSGSITLNGCDIVSNSNAADALYATSTVSTDCAYSVGGAHAPALTTRVCKNVKVNAPIVRDPYKGVVEPTNPGNCKSRHQGHPTLPSAPLQPGCYNGLTVKGELHFEPGVYYINGGEFNVNSGDNSKLTGSGVTIFLNGAKLNIGTTIKVNFSAPTNAENPYAGILYFGDRKSTITSHTLTGAAGSDYTGAIYIPTSRIDFAGSSKTGAGGCIQIIARRVTFTGASTLGSSCANAGTRNILTNEVVTLVE